MTRTGSHGRAASQLAHVSKRRHAVATIASAAALAMVATACSSGGDEEPAASEPEAFFEGETITWIVPHAAGGGTDSLARQLAPLLTEYLPGNPDVVIENIPEVGGMKGMNDFAAADHDGLHLVATSLSVNMNYLFNDPEFVQWEFSGLRPLIGLPGTSIEYASTRTGIETPEEFVAGDTDEPLIYGGISPGSGELPRVLAHNLIELDIEEIFGYESRPAARLALEQGETNISADSSESYQADVERLVDSGDVVPLWTSGLIEGGEVVRDPRYPELPTAPELYEMKHGEAPEGEGWDAYTFLVQIGGSLQRVVATHSDAPQVAVDAYEEALLAIEEDPAYIDGLGAELGTSFIHGDELVELAGAMNEVPEDTIDWINTWLHETYPDAN